jgi:hypothetical protein
MAVINKTGITNGGTIQAEHITRAIDALSGVGTDTIIASGSFSGSLIGGPVTVSTVTANGPIVGASLTGASLTIDTGNVYGISPEAGVTISFNSSNEDFNTVINHYGGAAVTSFTANGITTNNRIIATSFTGSLQGTASFAVSSSQAVSSSFATSASIATTASFALNASSFPFTGSARITGSLSVTGSLTVTGPISASGGIGGLNKVSSVDLSGISNGTGRFILPGAASSNPAAGAMYWDDSTGLLYVFKASDPAGWISINA